MSPQKQAKLGLRERKKQEKLERIERAARTLFSRDGYDGTSTRAIAEEAGIGVGTLFVYFPEKRDLLFHMFTSNIGAVRDQALGSLPDGTVVDRLMWVFRAFFDYYERDRALARVFVKEMSFMVDRPAELNTFTFVLLEGLADIVREGMRTGEVARSINPLSVAWSAFGLYAASIISWLGGSIPVRENQLAMLRSGLELLYRGMEPRS